MSVAVKTGSGLPASGLRDVRLMDLLGYGSVDSVVV